MVRATALTVGDHAGGEKMVLEPPINSAQRRKLGDITNLQNQNKLVNQGSKQQQHAILVSSKENAENLQKENMGLMKVVVERDGIKRELQKLKIDFQKIQEQNLLLAQANTRISAEFNTSKDQVMPFPRFPLRRRSARLKSQEPEPSESFHESIETAMRRSTMFNIQELGGVIQILNGLHDDQEIAAKVGCSARRQSIGSITEGGEPHDTKEITGKSRVSLRRQSARFNFQELDVTEKLNGLHDDQAIAANAGCSASKQSMGFKPEAVEPHDMTGTTGEKRVSSRRQSANVKTQRAIKETDPPLHDDIVDKSSPILCTVPMEVKRESKNKPTGDASEVMIKTTVGRPLRQAAENIKSYKEPSLRRRCEGTCRAYYVFDSAASLLLNELLVDAIFVGVFASLNQGELASGLATVQEADWKV